MFDKDIIDKLYNDELRKDSVFGAFPCEILAEQDEEDKSYVLVKLPGGEVVFARMCFVFPLVATFSKEWLSKYSDNIYAWVVFERGLPENPIVIGFSFKDGKFPSNSNYPNSVDIISENYQITIDDLDNRLEIKQISGKEQEIVITKDKVFIKSDDINIGDETASEPTVLGETLENLLNELLDTIIQGKIATSLGPQVFMPDTQVKLNDIKSKISDIKSLKSKIS